jgi:hypothetical protein
VLNIWNSNFRFTHPSLPASNIQISVHLAFLKDLQTLLVILNGF